MQISQAEGEIKDILDVTPEDQGDTSKTAADQGNAIIGGSYAQRIWVGSVGDVTFVKPEGGTGVLYNVAAGDWRKTPPMRNIQSTGTEPTEITVASVI